MPEKNVRDMIYAPIIDGEREEVRTISLVVTKGCNLRCSYCYEKHDQRDQVIMDLSLAKDTITRYMEADDGYNLVSIEFFGGEPMLAFNFIREVVEWSYTQKWRKDHNFLIGTNGTILTDEMKNWLYKNRRNVHISFSCDGSRIAHNLSRDNSYDRVRQNIPFFIENWPQQAAKMTISAETIPYVAEGVIELEELGLFFTANIGFEDMWGDEKEKIRLLGIYEEQLMQLVDYYSKRPHLYPVTQIMSAVPDYLGLPDYGKSEWEKKEVKRFCGAGHEMTIVDIDGKTYACHRFLPWVTGRSSPGNAVNCQSAWKPDKCAQCKLILSCPTCAGFNWEINNDTGIRSTFHCEAYKIEVLASCRLEANRLSGRLSELDKMSQKEKKLVKKRLEAIWDLIEDGV